MAAVVQVAEDLRQRILALYDQHLAPDGRAVDYAALGADPAFAAFCTAAAELQARSVAFYHEFVSLLCRAFSFLYMRRARVESQAKTCSFERAKQPVCFGLGLRVPACVSCNLGELRVGRRLPVTPCDAVCTRPEGQILGRQACELHLYVLLHCEQPSLHSQRMLSLCMRARAGRQRPPKTGTHSCVTQGEGCRVQYALKCGRW